MKKNEINVLLREYVREEITPLQKDRDFISKIYSSFQNMLGRENCLQIGSYPRFTSIRPLHDLDILYLSGSWNSINITNPSPLLSDLKRILEREYKNPTPYKTAIELQTHSVTISFLDSEKEVFSVDLVPAYSFGKNEFLEDTYMVPEILNRRHDRRKYFYEKIRASGKSVGWIKTDPRGYIEMAKRVNERNNDFRKSVKFIKAWRHFCKENNKGFKLKSFHIEQILTKYFIENNNLEIFDAVFKFFFSIPEIIKVAQIPDRADPNKKIDDYINNLTPQDRTLLLCARDYFLIHFENFKGKSSIKDLLRGDLYSRKSSSEEYLFDSKIPVLLEEIGSPLQIVGNVLPRDGGWRPFVLSSLGIISIDRKIQFRVKNPETDVLYKWKVKNDNSSLQPRGEITNHKTLNDPEHTRYKGNHFVECYAIKNDVCIARARQSVVLINSNQ